VWLNGKPEFSVFYELPEMDLPSGLAYEASYLRHTFSVRQFQGIAHVKSLRLFWLALRVFPAFESY